jgi:translocator protein
MKKTYKIIISILIPFIAGAIGSFFTSPAITGWYSLIEKPRINPPSWVFGPAWTIIYILMGISLYLIWSKGCKENKVKVAISIFMIQLMLNSVWSILFFGLKNPGLAFIEIFFLWISILITIIFFYKISKKAAYLLVPYILWVSFASYLNYSIWILN